MLCLTLQPNSCYLFFYWGEIFLKRNLMTRCCVHRCFVSNTLGSKGVRNAMDGGRSKEYQTVFFIPLKKTVQNSKHLSRHAQAWQNLCHIMSTMIQQHTKLLSCGWPVTIFQFSQKCRNFSRITKEIRMQPWISRKVQVPLKLFSCKFMHFSYTFETGILEKYFHK